MSETRKYNRFEKELKEINQNCSPADLKVLQDLTRAIEQIENIPTLPQEKPNIHEESTLQQFQQYSVS